MCRGCTDARTDLRKLKQQLHDLKRNVIQSIEDDDRRRGDGRGKAAKADAEIRKDREEIQTRSRF